MTEQNETYTGNVIRRCCIKSMENGYTAIIQYKILLLTIECTECERIWSYQDSGEEILWKERWSKTSPL